jgi:hypothetical protein
MKERCLNCGEFKTFWKTHRCRVPQHMWTPPEPPPSPKGQGGRRNMKVSDLEEPIRLSDNDYLLMTDTSEKKSVKVRLSVLREYIKS